MTESILKLVISILITLSLFFESYGFMLRVIGVKNGNPSLGYSFHVQLATLSRFGTFLAFPLIAYMLENGVSSSSLAQIPVISYLFVAIALIIIKKYKNLNIRFSKFLFKKLSSFSKLSVKNNFSTKEKNNFTEKISKRNKNRIVYFGTFAFLFTSSAFFITSLVANSFLDYRATIIQCTPFISSIGTIVSVLYFDPTISSLIDKLNNPERLIYIVWKARIIGAFLISFFFGLFYVLYL